MTVQTRRFVPGSLTAFPRHWTIAWLVAAALGVASTAAAQEPAAPPEPQEQEYATRAEADRARREAKSAEVTEYEPNKVERALDFVEDRGIFLLDREGFYPKLGSLSVSSGFAYGVGFRDRDLFDNQGALDIWGAASILGYWGTEARMTFPRLAGQKLHLEAWLGHRDSPRENFFGLGPDSERANRSDYACLQLRTVLVGRGERIAPDRARPGPFPGSTKGRFPGHVLLVASSARSGHH